MDETSVESQKTIFEHLGELANRDSLFFPKQVIKELAQTGSVNAGVTGRPFPPYHWAKKTADVACVDSQMFDELQAVLEHPQARRVFEPDKVSGEEQADPHVLALAVYLRDKGYSGVTVVTEDRRDKPHKLSLQSACGILGFSTLPVRPFLVEVGLLPPFPPK